MIERQPIFGRGPRLAPRGQKSVVDESGLHSDRDDVCQLADRDLLCRFGLSMDDEVFLLSRIKEEFERCGDNERAVAVGLERSGRVVSAAAILIALVFLSSIVTASKAVSKALGLGLGLVVLLERSLIRGTLVPALMKLAGSANWWAPSPLRWLHERIGIREHVEFDRAHEYLEARAREAAQPVGAGLSSARTGFSTLNAR